MEQGGMRPDLNWGPDLHPSEIKVGDLVKQMANKRTSGFSGRVTKTARVNIHVMCSYMMGTVETPLELGPLRRTTVDLVKRGDIYHKVIGSTYSPP
jgi:hypothetical protein